MFKFKWQLKKFYKSHSQSHAHTQTYTHTRARAYNVRIYVNFKFLFRTVYLEESNITEMNTADLSEANSTNNEQNSDVFWILLDCFLFVAIILGNILTILAIAWARKLRSVVSNYFILNLAMSDLMVGITLPYHLAFYVDSALHRNKSVCISRFVMFTLACGGSIYNIIVIAIDRYVAIVHPLSYNAYATKRRVLLIIVVAWICTMGVSSIPIYWNRFDKSHSCELETVLPRYHIYHYSIDSSFSSQYSVRNHDSCVILFHISR